MLTECFHIPARFSRKSPKVLTVLTGSPLEVIEPVKISIYESHQEFSCSTVNSSTTSGTTSSLETTQVCIRPERKRRRVRHKKRSLLAALKNG